MIRARLHKTGLLDSKSTEADWKRDRVFDQLLNDESLRRTARRYEGGGVVPMTCKHLYQAVVLVVAEPQRPLPRWGGDVVMCGR